MPTLVTSYDTWGRAPVVFKSWKPGHEALPLWSVCRASCAAPGYFPAQVMQLGDHPRPLIDGGIVANNPAACALAEGWKIIKGQGRDPAAMLRYVASGPFPPATDLGAMGSALGLPEAVTAVMEKHIRGGLTAEEAVELGLPVKDYTLGTLEERATWGRYGL